MLDIYNVLDAISEIVYVSVRNVRIVLARTVRGFLSIFVKM